MTNETRRQRVRDWLMNKERIRQTRDRYQPTEQDVEDVLALLDWPEYRQEYAETPEMGASILLTELRLIRREIKL